jgi:hypothetical protein
MSHTPKGVIRPVTLVQVPNALSCQKPAGPPQRRGFAEHIVDQKDFKF